MIFRMMIIEPVLRSHHRYRFNFAGLSDADLLLSEELFQANAAMPALESCSTHENKENLIGSFR